ncbi:MAG TPA: hypothetical protein PKE57_07570 [Cellvibrionaceae bacterium]|nr:hypothetical protein [Cellvibrionaceae bacterium]HMW48164.1 hypothetical protein [Cellvibrionaceae bacterium]HMW71078.1 hypothetical protein [Cellvibrionaceae bacterium]HMY39066.1 hypothetical protein [Marinagarivorans sp.]HNG60490.1 hypothetical protein [Cellvibrionaceae bacterium]
MKILIALLLLALTACAAVAQKTRQAFFPVNQSKVLLPVLTSAFVPGEMHVYLQLEVRYAVFFIPLMAPMRIRMFLFSH